MTRHPIMGGWGNKYGGGNGKQQLGWGRSLSIPMPTTLDLGIGVLYFFTSHMVIRAMYYIAFNRTQHELDIFFTITAAALVLAQLLFHPLTRLRLESESTFDLPVVSIIAATGIAVALTSMLPVAHVSLFYLSAALLGFSCGWICVIWASTIHRQHIGPSTFHIEPALVIAVITYFAFRLISSFSYEAAQGLLLAMPLITIACIMHPRTGPNVAKDAEDAMSPLRVLIVVAAFFALAGGVTMGISGYEGVVLESSANYMVFFEACAATLILLCCKLLCKITRPRTTAGRPWEAIIYCVIYLPPFAMGTIMGGMGIPSESPNALWEGNLWVLLIAIFAYDIRDSLFAVKGLAIGIMFESMRIGQIISRMTVLEPPALPAALGVLLGVLYLIGSALQFSRPRISKSSQLVNIRNQMNQTESSENNPHEMPHNKYASCKKAEKNIPSTEVIQSSQEPIVDPSSETHGDIVSSCRSIALSYGLTEREAEVLALCALGRSAKYIADELFISYNTACTHIKHVYEKLDIHSKQELIDLVTLKG